VSATAFGEEDHWKVEPFRQLEEAVLFSMVLQTLGPGQHCVVVGHDDRAVRWPVCRLRKTADGRRSSSPSA